MSKKGNMVSLVLTFLVVAIYLTPNFVQAVAVSVSTDKTDYILTHPIETELSILIRENERIPVQDISLLLDGNEICKFNVDGSKITACAGITITQTSTGDYGPGTLEGTDEATEEFTSFGYGTDQTLNGYTGTLSYNIVIDTTTLQVVEGTHTLQLSVNAVGTDGEHVYSGQTSFNVITAPDLEISNLRLIYPQNPGTTSGTMYAFTIKNIGEIATDNIFWKLNTGEDVIYSGYSFSLAVDEDIFVYTAPYVYTSTGTKVVTAVVDYEDKIAEINEENNEESISVTVS